MKRSIEEAVRDVVLKLFTDGSIRSVTVTEGEDHEGIRILDIMVVYKKKGLLDPRKTVNLARLLRDRLLEEEETAFPIVSYISAKDAAELKTAAA